VRARRRQLHVTVMGITEEIADRKWQDGAVRNTLRRYSDVEKAYLGQFASKRSDRDLFCRTGV
jgi:hypothetical protein